MGYQPHHVHQVYARLVGGACQVPPWYLPPCTATRTNVVPSAYSVCVRFDSCAGGFLVCGVQVLLSLNVNPGKSSQGAEPHGVHLP